MKLLRKLYDWVLHWADTPYGATALFILAFAESSFFPIPPDALLIALILGSNKKAFKFATICLVGSVLELYSGMQLVIFFGGHQPTSLQELQISSLIIFQDLRHLLFMIFRNYMLNMISG